MLVCPQHGPLLGKQLPDGSIEFVRESVDQTYTGKFDPKTGKLTGTFDCRVTPAQGVGWEVTRQSFDGHPILTEAGANIRLPTQPTEVPSGGLTIRAGSRQVNTGETVMIPVEVIGGSGLGNLNVAVEYDTSVAQVRQAGTHTDLLSDRLFESNHQESGVVRFGFAGRSGLSGDGIMTMVPFTASGNPGKRTALKVTVSSANHTDGQPLESTTVDGELEVVAKGGAGSGDVNSDGQVNALDALAALKMSVKLIADNMAADMDQDGTITSNDARLIMLKYVGR